MNKWLTSNELMYLNIHREQNCCLQNERSKPQPCVVQKYLANP